MSEANANCLKARLCRDGVLLASLVALVAPIGGCAGQEVRICLGDSREAVLARLARAYPQANRSGQFWGENASGSIMSFEVWAPAGRSDGRLEGWHLLMALSDDGKVRELGRIRQVDRAAVADDHCLCLAEETGSRRVLRWVEVGQTYPADAWVNAWIPGLHEAAMSVLRSGKAPRPMTLECTSFGFDMPPPLCRRFLWAQDAQGRMTHMFFLDMGARSATIANGRVTLSHE